MILGSKGIVAFLGGLALVGLIVIGYSLLRQLGCEGQMVNISYTPSPQQEIRGEQSVGQTFVAPRNDLNRVDVLLQSYGRQNTRDVTFRLLEIPGGANDLSQTEEIYNTTFNAQAARNQTWYTFRFPPVANSAGKTYLLVLQSPTSEPGNAITVGGIDEDKYPLGSAFVGPQPIFGDITFRACFQLSAAEKFQFLATQLTQNRPGLWGNITFYVLSLGIYLLLLIGFFWRLVKFVLD